MGEFGAVGKASGQHLHYWSGACVCPFNVFAGNKIPPCASPDFQCKTFLSGNYAHLHALSVSGSRDLNFRFAASPFINNAYFAKTIVFFWMGKIVSNAWGLIMLPQVFLEKLVELHESTIHHAHNKVIKLYQPYKTPTVKQDKFASFNLHAFPNGLNFYTDKYPQVYLTLMLLLVIKWECVEWNYIFTIEFHCLFLPFLFVLFSALCKRQCKM